MKPAVMPSLERLQQNEANLAARQRQEWRASLDETASSAEHRSTPSTDTTMVGFLPHTDVTISAASATSARTASRVQALEHALARKAGEYATLYDEACVLKAANNEMNAVHMALTERLKREQAWRKEAEAQTVAAKTERDSLEHLLSDKVGQVEGLIALVYQLQRSCEQLEVGAAHTATAELTAVTKRAESLETSCRDLQAQLAVAQSAVRTPYPAPAHPKRLPTDGSGVIPPGRDDGAVRIGELTRQMDSLAAANRALVHEHDVQTAVVAQLRQQVASQTSLNASLTAENNRLAAAAQSASDALTYLKETQQTKQSNRLSDELVVARTAATSASAENSELAHQLEESRIRAALLADQNASLVTTTTQLEKLVQDQVARIKSLASRQTPEPPVPTASARVQTDAIQQDGIAASTSTDDLRSELIDAWVQTTQNVVVTAATVTATATPHPTSVTTSTQTLALTSNTASPQESIQPVVLSHTFSSEASADVVPTALWQRLTTTANQDRPRCIPDAKSPASIASKTVTNESGHNTLEFKCEHRPQYSHALVQTDIVRTADAATTHGPPRILSSRESQTISPRRTEASSQTIQSRMAHTQSQTDAFHAPHAEKSVCVATTQTNDPAGLDVATQLARKRKRGLMRKQLKMVRMKLANALLELRDIKETSRGLDCAVKRLQTSLATSREMHETCQAKLLKFTETEDRLTSPARRFDRQGKFGGVPPPPPPFAASTPHHGTAEDIDA